MSAFFFSHFNIFFSGILSFSKLRFALLFFFFFPLEACVRACVRNHLLCAVIIAPLLLSLCGTNRSAVIR